MFDWFGRIFRRSVGDKRRQFFATVDAINEEAGGGPPVAIRKSLGILTLRSGALTLGDIQRGSDIEVPNIPARELAIHAWLSRYPSGAETITALTLSLDGAMAGETRRKIGQLGIDSARLFIADKADIDEHWTDVGRDRIGVILTASDDTLLRLLTKRFKLKTAHIDGLRTEVVGPVSSVLEKEIEDFLKSDPRYADYPFMHFRVQTNNSFERANYLDASWALMPIGNDDTPLMFVCGTGRGDGLYDVECEFAGDIPRVLHINFFDEIAVTNKSASR
jgi:hypothetical protein